LIATSKEAMIEEAKSLTGLRLTGLDRFISGANLL
jgi:hypothetical protein